MSRRGGKDRESLLEVSQGLSGTATPRGSDRRAARGIVSPRVPGRHRADDKKEYTSVYVETVDEKTHIAEGSIVAFQFVSKGKWMWAIGTVVSDGATADGVGSSPAVTDPGLVSLLCWKVVWNSKDDVPEREERVVETAQERRERISRELYVHDVMRRENIVEGIRKDIRNISRESWKELMRLKEAPKAVLRAVRAVFELLCIELVASSESDEWDQMKRFMASSAFTDLLSDPNAVRMDDALADALNEKYLSDRLFDFTVVSANNRLAGLLQKWVTSEVYLYKARASLRMIDDQLSDTMGAQGSKFSASLRSGNSSTRVRPFSGRDGEDSVKMTVRSFSESGEISFVRTDEKVVVLQMSIFCKLIPITGPLKSKEMILKRDSIAQIRSAASKQLRGTPRGSNVATRVAGDRHVTESYVSTAPTGLTHIFCNQSIERLRLVARELGSLFDLHQMFTAERWKIMHRDTTSLRDRPNNISSKSADSERKLSRAMKRINELEGHLREKEDELRDVWGKTEEETKSLKKHVRSRSDEDSERRVNRGCGLNFRILCLLQDEEVNRMRLGTIEIQERFMLQLRETRSSNDMALNELKAEYVKETIALQREVSNLEGCQQRALSILRECLSRTQEGPLKHQQYVEKEDLHSCLLDVEQAMMELGASRLPSTHLFSERSDECTEHRTSRITTRRDAHAQTHALERLKNVVDDVGDNDVILIKDRLVEAMYDRELIQELLTREQQKCRELEKKEETLLLDLEQVTNQRTELDEEVQVLQAEVEALTKALKRATDGNKDADVHGARRPNSKKSGMDFMDGDDEQQTTEVAETFNSANTVQDQWLINLLEEEGVDHSGGVFTALCTYIEQLKANRATLEADRDMHASEARMLEMCLKTAADALEDALLHDERWRPRTTSSQHTTFHSKKFPGDDWGLVAANTPEALVNAIVHDVAAACHLPEDYVLDVDYRDDGVELHVTFDLRHDPSITTEEIARRLEECNFYEMEKIYANRHERKSGIDELRRDLQAKVEEINALRGTLRRLQTGTSGYSYSSR